MKSSVSSQDHLSPVYNVVFFVFHKTLFPLFFLFIPFFFNFTPPFASACLSCSVSAIYPLTAHLCMFFFFLIECFFFFVFFCAIIFDFSPAYTTVL